MSYRYYSPVRLGVGVLFLILGVMTAIAPDTFFSTAHKEFFASVPRELWSIVQVVVGMFMLSSQRDVTPLFAGSVLCATWAQVAIFPYIARHNSWNSVSFMVWCCLWALCILDVCRQQRWWPYNRKRNP